MSFFSIIQNNKQLVIIANDFDFFYYTSMHDAIIASIYLWFKNTKNNEVCDFPILFQSNFVEHINYESRLILLSIFQRIQ